MNLRKQIKRLKKSGWDYNIEPILKLYMMAIDSFTKNSNKKRDMSGWNNPATLIDLNGKRVIK